MGGGAWPFLVGGVICLVNSVNERDLGLLTSHALRLKGGRLLRGTLGVQPREVQGNNRSVMPLDVLGCTRATMISSTSIYIYLYCCIGKYGQSQTLIVLGIDDCNYLS
eukprot:TRINITY_DN9_c0_g1_i12.p5 TRINITY_DN9_c0_g1~~TRINITY_DN9_c0_g1_i12.p5  ORF type:complete len:108 (-),score=1.73 TRINITY_DN9_c0_g1_i12:324-647(-)